MSATYEECEQVRDLVAAVLLDGIHVSAVGLGRNETRDWRVVVMSNKDEGKTKIPKLPKELGHVEILVRQTSPFKAHGRMQ